MQYKKTKSLKDKMDVFTDSTWQTIFMEGFQTDYPADDTVIYYIKC